ncbi:MAG TPA: DUF4040 domain-containing protein [Elainellaceae cyanobacterium]
MPEDIYVLVITALLPLTACMLVLQVDPYHALVIRGILGAVAALVYALFGAADVALTEALVGTMLSITLYAVAVRSSLSMRLGVLEQESMTLPKAVVTNVVTNTDAAPSAIADPLPERSPSSAQLLLALHTLLSKYHMRLELVPYPNLQALQTALISKDVHTACVVSRHETIRELPQPPCSDEQPRYHLQTRIHRLYEIMQSELPSTVAHLSYVESVSATANSSISIDPHEVKL